MAASDAGGPAAWAFALLFFLPGLFTRGLFPPDETRYADVALAMEESGDWLVPHLHEKLYFEKPPVFFWLIAGLHEAGVPLQVAPRLLSVLAAIGVLLLLPRIARACGIAPAAAGRAGLLLVATPLFAIYAQLGIIDPLLAFLTTAAAACKLARGETAPPRVRTRLAWLEGGVLGVALLTKGPVVLLFAAALRIGAALARERAPGRVDRRDALAGGVAVLIAGAWLVAAGVAGNWDYVDRLTIGQLERRIGGTERLHQVFPGFAVACVLAGALPWTLFTLGALPWSAWRAMLRAPPRLAALLGWGVLPVLLIACLPTQQPHYALPALPPLALLAGEALARPVPKWAARAAALLGVLLGASFVAAAALLPALGRALGFDPMLSERFDGDGILRGVLGFVGVGWLAISLWPARAGRSQPALRGFAGVAVLLLALPLLFLRLDDVMTARALTRDPAIAAARRVVAPTGLRSALRIVTRHPRVEEYEQRDVMDLLAADPGLVAVEWRDDLVERGLLAQVDVVATGFLRGRALVAVRSRRPAPGGGE